MKGGDFNSWQDVYEAVLKRIHSRHWKPGELIPNEVDLAEEFGCARATVNRALQAIAEQGFLDRRRKAGTRVAVLPARRATLKIPVIRREIEDLNMTYGYHLAHCRLEKPCDQVKATMSLAGDLALLHIEAVHTADGQPYVLEDRWLDQNAIVGASDADFSTRSANEWLVENAAFSHGEIVFSATIATQDNSPQLNATPGDPLFVIERTTWNGTRAITHVKLLYGPDYRMKTVI